MPSIQHANDENGASYNTKSGHVSPFVKVIPRKIVSRSREMLKIDVSLEYVRSQISELGQSADKMEDDLTQKRQQLEEEARHFDHFIEATDKQAKDAVDAADKQTKIRLAKARELQQYKQKLQVVESDTTKKREMLEDYSKYRAFLDGLTPTEWTDAQLTAKKERQEERRKRRIEKRQEVWLAEQNHEERKGREEVAAFAKGGKDPRIAASSERPRRRTTRAKVATSGATTDDAGNNDNVMLSPPEFEDEPLTDSDEELPMYFERPQQLEDILTALEDETCKTSNQEACSMADLDEVAREDRKVQRLKISIKEDGVETKQLQEQTDQYCKDEREDEEELLQRIDEKVRKVYRTCGFSASDSSSTLVMLEHIELAFDSLLRDETKDEREKE